METDCVVCELGICVCNLDECQWLRCELGPVYVGCVVKKYALGSVLLQTLTFSLPVSAYQGSTHIFIFTAALNGRKSGRSLGTLLQINALSESLEH